METTRYALIVVAALVTCGTWLFHVLVADGDYKAAFAKNPSLACCLGIVFSGVLIFVMFLVAIILNGDISVPEEDQGAEIVASYMP